MNDLGGYTRLMSGFDTTGTDWRPGGKRWREQTNQLWAFMRRSMIYSKQLREELYPINGSDHIPRNVALLARIVRELATLYVTSPSRRFVGLAPELQDTLRSVYREAEVDLAFRMSHESMVGLGNSMLWFWPDIENQTVRPLVVNPANIEVKLRVLTGKRISDCEWIRVRMPVSDDPVQGLTQWGVAEISATRAYWVSAPGDMQGAGLWREDGANPLGMIPAVILRASMPDIADFWANVPEDLLDASFAVNDSATDLSEIGRKQGFAQAWASGLSQDQAKEMQGGPETVIALPETDQTFGYASANPDLTGLRESGDAYIRSVVATNGINPATLMRSQGITALAKTIELADRQTERARYLPQFEKAEQRAYDVITGWLNLMRGQAVYGPAKVEVRYHIPAPPADPQAAAQALGLEIDLGLTSAARERMRRDGLDTIEEAEALVLADLRSSRRIAAAANMLDDEPAEVDDVLALVP